MVYNNLMAPSVSAPGRVEVVDSHTAGEPTRVVVAGGPDLGRGDLQSRLQLFRTRHDSFRSSVICEPRGSEVVVGALLCEPVSPSSAAAVIFFNDVSYLGMCGHGTIGLVTTLAHLGRLTSGEHQIETPVGPVLTHLHSDQSVSVQNVPSYRHLANVTVDVANHGRFTGDVAWGGNWFFLVSDHTFELETKNRAELVAVTAAIRQALIDKGITGKNNQLIDHIELCGPPQDPANSGRNFVLCPGAAFDRSPCGTGTSAKMACMYADGKLAPGSVWRQEGILGTVFEGSILAQGDCVLPTITGRAWITAQSTLLFDSSDPFHAGIVF
jgi:4-hydroxyproline epimerase